MKLRQIKLENFRSYQNETVIHIEKDLTAFIGKNDVGKSTVLEALEIFFNNKSPKLDVSDLNVNADKENDVIRISCLFDHLPDFIIIDSENSTNLLDEFLLNRDGLLEIVKEYKCSGAKPTETIYLRANFPSHRDYKDILEKTNSDLKKSANGLNVTDQRKNAELRRAIRNNIGQENLQPVIQLLSLKKGESKDIWDKLSTQLPIFALFRSDRTSSDQDSEVQDPMKLAVDMALKRVQTKLDEIKDEVQQQALDVARRTISKLGEMDESLAKELVPLFREDPKWNGIFKLTLNSENDIPINKRGSGVRRLILLNFFRAEAERLKEEKQIAEIIFAIEEPETSQHPSNQELILKTLLDIAKSGKSQILLTTHVPALASLLPLESLRFIYQEGNRPIIDDPSYETYKKITESLGILPYEDTAKAKGIVMVEGYADVFFLRHTATELKKGGKLKYDLEDIGIVPLITGGCGNLKHWINLQLLEYLQKPYCVFLDSDKTKEDDIPGGVKNQKNIQEMKDKGVTIFFTRKRETENYLCPSVIDNCSIEISQFDDVKKLFPKYGSKILEKCWPKMTCAKILDRDVFTDSTGNQRHELLELISNIYDVLQNGKNIAKA